MRFSKYAVIGTVDDEDQRPALMIRLADIQHRLYIAESHVRLYMATTKINKVAANLQNIANRTESSMLCYSVANAN